MTTYTYATTGDASLFFEVPDAATTAAPQRVAAGTAIPCLDTATRQPVPDLIVRAAGYVEQQWECPRIDAQVDGASLTIYSQEWLATRGEGGACHYWTQESLPADVGLLLVGDLCLLAAGITVRWDGTSWVTVTTAGGGAGGVVVDAPSTGGTTGGTGSTGPTSPTPTAEPQTIPYSTSFDSMGAWRENSYHPGAAASGGQMHLAGEGTAHVELLPVTPGSWVEVAVTSSASSSGGASLFLFSCNGDSYAASTDWIDAGTFQALTAGGEVKVKYQVASGADRIGVGLQGKTASTSWHVDALSVTATSAPVVTTPPAGGGTTGGTGIALPASLVAGASPYVPEHYKALWGSTAFAKSGKGWARHNPGNPFATGKYVHDKLMFAWGNDNSWINVEDFNIPCTIVDTRKPPGPVSQGGGGYVWASPKKFMGDPSQPYDADLWENNYEAFMANIPFPVDFQPAAGTDKSAEWIDIATMTQYGGWAWENVNGAWQFTTAVRSDRIDKNTSGAYDKGTLVASGLMGAPMQLGIAEVQEYVRSGTHIQHALGVELPECDGFYDTFSWPAKHSDANGDSGHGLYQGARLMLDPTFNIAASSLSPTMKMLAYTLQEWGWIITDTSGSVALRTEVWRGDPKANPWYSLLPEREISALPWDRVYVTARDAGKP